MNYEIKDTHVYGKLIAQNGKPVITNHDEAMALAEKYNGMLWKLHTGRYVVKVPDYVTSLEECGGEPMPQSYNQYPDHEVQMARQELYRTAKLALSIHDLLKNVGENQGLEGWLQRKITRAADYIESVYDYLDYEMRFPSDMMEDDMSQAGMSTGAPQPQNPSPTQQTQQTPGTPPQKPGMSKTPGMVKMAKIDANGNVQGVPVMVPSAQVKSKQQAGFHVIGESASGGASSAGGIAVGAMNGGAGSSSIGSLFGGTYNQKKKRKKTNEKVDEAFKPLGSISTPSSRHQTASAYMHDPDRAAVVYKPNKYDPKTGLGGYVANRARSNEPLNTSIISQLKKNLDSAIGQPLQFTSGDTLEINPMIAKKALAKLSGLKPVQRHEAVQSIMASKENFINFIKETSESMKSAENNPSGPEFTGYWKGTDKGKPGKKMVGGGP